MEEAISSQLELNEIYYNQMYDNFKKLAQNVNSLIINDKDTIAIFKEAIDADEQKKAEIRDKLYNHLSKNYLYLQSIGFRQLHFHLPDNRSFLRMHKPTKFGDDLSDIRYTIKMVNQKLEPVEGFEEGRVVNGFRFVYPIFDEQHKHIGSAEASISSKGFIDGIESAYKSSVYFIIKKSVADSKLWQEEIAEHYTNSLTCKNFYIEKKDDYKQQQESLKRLEILNTEIETKLKENKKFAVHTTDDKLISFLPIRNIKDNEVVAYFVIHTKNKTIQNAITVYWMSTLAILVLLTTILYLIHKEYFYRKSIEQLNSDLSKRVDDDIQLMRKKDQQMLLNSRLAQMGELISMIAHQWRQPLASIAATTIDMKVKLDLDTYNLKEIPEGSECRDYFNQSLDAINARIKNLTTTVDDFRNFYKPHKELTLISITQPIRQAVNIVGSSFSPQRISITETYHSFESLLLHSNEVVHVILNILKNSQDNFKEKRTPNPHIHIQTYEENENYLCIEICDNGGGIHKDVIDKVYDPYFSTKDEKNGSGLGLYMSKVIIEEHHKGTLRVKNSDEGLCTIITFKKTPNTLSNTEEIQ